MLTSDEGLTEYLNGLLDDRGFEHTQPVRERIVWVLDMADRWKRQIAGVNNSLEDVKAELAQAHAVIAAIHPDGFPAFSKYEHREVCEHVRLLWRMVDEKIRVIHRMSLEFEVEVKEDDDV